MTPDEIRKDGGRTRVFLQRFTFITVPFIIAFGAFAAYQPTLEDLVTYGIILPFTLLWALVHSPTFQVIAGMFLVLLCIASVSRAWENHCDRQRRIIELLEKIDRNEQARYAALAEKVEHCARTLAQEYREYQ